MCDIRKSDKSSGTDSTDGTTSKKNQAAEPLRRFEIKPLKRKEPTVLTPVPSPAPILIVQQPSLFTDQQMVAILIVLFAIICVGVIAHAMRG
jgi:hypothetical protein